MKGLYTLKPIKVSYGNRKVDLYYRSNEGVLLDTVGIPVIYSEPNYLGTSDLIPATYTVGDWFTYNGKNPLNYGDEIAYFKTGYCYEYDGSRWVEMAKEDKKVGMAVTSMLADDSTNWNEATEQNAPTVQLIESLVANEAFIKKLATTMITLQKDDHNNGGIIKSSNYNGLLNNRNEIVEYGDKGWAIDYNGKADFSNGNFSGTLNCGSLQVNKKLIETGKRTYAKSTYATNIASQNIKNYGELVENSYESYESYDSIVYKGFNFYYKLWQTNVNNLLFVYKAIIHLDDILEEDETLYYRGIPCNAIAYCSYENISNYVPPRVVGTGYSQEGFCLYGRHLENNQYVFFNLESKISIYSKEDNIYFYPVEEFNSHSAEELINNFQRINYSEYYSINQHPLTNEEMEIFQKNTDTSNIYITKKDETLVLSMKDLPKEAPVTSGIIWDDNGTLKIS